MEAVLFIGLQGAGKTTFYHQRFAGTHVRISLDQLKTRPKEMQALRRAIEARQKIVIDNTNPTIQERSRYIQTARAAAYSIVGYYFEPDIHGSLKRNAARSGKERVPVPGIFGTRKRLQVPSVSEGFDSLWSVRISPDGEFVVQCWCQEPNQPII